MHSRIRQSLVAMVAGCLMAACPSSPVQGAGDLESARELVRQGRYEDALDVATEAAGRNVYFDGWHLLKADVELTLGKWEAARTTLEAALKRHSWSIQLRWMAREAYRRTGDDGAAERMEEEILKLAEASPWRFTDPRNLVVLGQLALARGADAKEVLKAFFERAQASNAGTREPVKAIGALALSKHDFKLAASTFREGLEQFGEDPDLLYGLSVALRGSDPPESQNLLQQALTVNPRHVPSLLHVVDRLIDAEEYSKARSELEKILEINGDHDEALAYLAVLAHLDNDSEAEQQYREQALSSWATNPQVDHLIGRKLSQKYRFAEGLAYQWKSLEFDPSYLPARRQAAQDLLRLGEEDEGWQMAAGVFRDDAYDVTAYNLVTLREEIENFTTLQNESFLVRMESGEAQIYGQRVMKLLNQAKSTLCAKYGLDLREQVIVEIFPNPADFEVRTFGMPGVPGFLGVCFGRVITANSPAALSASPSNWESVLWHEFCHVVTLQLTRNRMPRWFSEGISVYEERLADPSWGQQMTPAYRQRILDGGLVPIADLSSAFTTPGEDIQFAYFESSLVIDFLVERYGLSSLLDVMHDLASGLPINEALPRHTDDLPVLEAEFAKFAAERAEDLAPGTDWSKPDIGGLLADDDSESLLRDWVTEHPDNYGGTMTFAAVLVENEKWDEAKTVLRRAIELYPDAIGGQSPYLRLAEIHRRLGETDEEASVLAELAVRDADAGATFLRLIELAEKRKDWQALELNCQRLMAVNPLTVHPHAGLARVAEEQARPELAVTAYQSLLALTPADPAELHYRLASGLQTLGRAGAKRHTLMALENAPRYRQAQRLLLQIVESNSASPDQPLLPELEKDVPDSNADDSGI